MATGAIGRSRPCANKFKIPLLADAPVPMPDINPPYLIRIHYGLRSLCSEKKNKVCVVRQKYPSCGMTLTSEVAWQNPKLTSYYVNFAVVIPSEFV